MQMGKEIAGLFFIFVHRNIYRCTNAIIARLLLFLYHQFNIKIHRDASMRREIEKLEVYCNFRNKGCREILPWNALDVSE